LSVSREMVTKLVAPFVLPRPRPFVSDGMREYYYFNKFESTIILNKF
jgi:hypothetical protein